MRPIKLLTATLLLLATPAAAAAQVVGGGNKHIYQFDGIGTLDRMGTSISAAGDVNADGYPDIIVGSPFTAFGSVVGHARVYSGVDGSVLHEWLSHEFYSNFGGAVAGVGDINGDGFDDLLVGATAADIGGVHNLGAVYLYSGADGSELRRWDSEAVYTQFGKRIAAAGDVNADGVPDIIISAVNSEQGSVALGGSIFVYSGADGSQLHRWDGENHYDHLGTAIAGAGDINGDGHDDILSGAYAINSGGLNDSGAAFVYSGADGSVLLHFEGTGSQQQFGSSIAGVGDVNQDGVPDILIGAPQSGEQGTSHMGAAMLYSGSGGALLYQWFGETRYIRFGQAVGGGGDLNHDGFIDLLVGAPDGGFGVACEAFAFSGADGSVLRKRVGEPDGDDDFGLPVVHLGDVNGDGYSDIAIGSRYASPGGLNGAGSVFIQSFNPFLLASHESISASTGGTVSFALDFPLAAAFFEYKVLASASGTGPSFYGVDIPLTHDSLVRNTFSGIYPIVSSTMHGTLDANGDGNASLTIPAGISTSLIGRTYYLAAVANQPGQLPEYSSVAVSLEITP